MEKLYYSCEFDPLCATCACEDDLDSEITTQYLPQCKGCKEKGVCREQHNHECLPTINFDNFMIDTLSDLAGSPRMDWAQLKASLPSSLGSLRACLHASAAYVSSVVQSQELVSGILRQPSSTPLHLADTISTLAEAAERPDWMTLEDVNVSHPCLPAQITLHTNTC